MISSNRPMSFIELEVQNNSGNKLRSRSDPLFRSMSYGFPLPRKVSFTASKSDEKYQTLNMCPTGCIVG